MAGKRMMWAALRGLILVAVMVLAAGLPGCGVKSPPLPSTTVAPMAVPDLKARAVAEGVELSFSVPGEENPNFFIREARLYYGYLPITGDPECPPCPPRLREYRVLEVAKQLKPGEAGQFTYLDRQAPMDMMAVYRVQLVDARGRAGKESGYARAVRATAPQAPQGLRVVQGDGQVSLTWQPVTLLADGRPAPEAPGYILYRQGPEGERALNERPMTKPELVDKSLSLGQVYRYRVAAVREINGSLIEGLPGPWVSASALDQTAPSPPSGLVGASFADGIYLRFTPSPEPDTAGYFVERATAKAGPFSRMNAKPLVENTFVDKAVKLGSVYYYRVLAVDEAGNLGQPSPAVEVKQQP